MKINLNHPDVFFCNIGFVFQRQVMSLEIAVYRRQSISHSLQDNIQNADVVAMSRQLLRPLGMTMATLLPGEGQWVIRVN